jgi:murein DD-endopeptidase MepM/ murein hydrolase activator NlpD
MLRWLLILVISAAAAFGILFVVAGRGAAPSISIDKPDRFIGRTGTLEVTAGAPGARFTDLSMTLEQNGRTVPLFSLATSEAGAISQPDADHLRISRSIGKQSIPELQTGPARIVVAASRKSFLNLRTLSSGATKDIQVRLEPPQLAVLSTHHYVNHGGAEMVVYRATPADVASGVRVGDLEYPGHPASGAGIAGAGPAVKVAFFALLHDQDLESTPIRVFAEDEAGNETTTAFVEKVFAKPFRRSRIPIDDRFIQRVVPEILQQSPELNMPPPSDDLLPAFLKINGELRRMNAERIAALTSATSPSRLWNGPFVQLGNSQVEASFADHRTYVYRGKEVDQQVHLGFDLAVTAAVPVIAANAGKVLNASWLGIYGNCVIVDHGMGVASLYGHLSSMHVKVGDTVTKGQTLGRSGMTGLAGGDHLHFTMLVNGRPVNPVEWWDAHWIQDRVDRKLSEAGSWSRSTTQ